MKVGVIISFKYRYRKQIMIGITIFIVISICTTTAIISLNKKKTKTNSKELLIAKKEDKKESIKEKEADIEYKVDIKGEVNAPGIYTLKKDSRVVDVIELAGGLTENANTEVINLSKKITDEMVIIIYSNYEVENFRQTKELESKLVENCINGNESIDNDACIESDTKEKNSNMVALNSATKEELMTLSGIGEAKAEDIIEYRKTIGEFKNIEEIKNIKGIGDSIFDKIKDRLTL